MELPSETAKPNASDAAQPHGSPNEIDTENRFDALWGLLNRIGLIYFLFALIVIFNVAFVFQVAMKRHDQHDFAHYYVSSQLYLEGQPDLYQTDFRPVYAAHGWDNLREPIYHASNPPSLIKLFSIYAWLPPDTAQLAWTLTQLIALGVAICATWLSVRDGLSVNGFLLVLALFLSFTFVRAHLYYSQVQLLLMALVLVGFRFQQQQRGLIGCVFVALAALLKLYPIVLLPWFVWRSGSTVSIRMKAAVLSLIVLLAGVWLTDIALWKDFFEFASPRISHWVRHNQCFTLSSFAEHVGDFVNGERENFLLYRAGIGLGVLLLAMFYAWLVFRSNVAERRDDRIELAVLILLMLFCGATCWWHYLVFLLFPLAVSATCLRRNLTIWKLFASLFVIGLLFPLTNNATDQSTLNLVLVFAPLFGMIAMAIYLFSVLAFSLSALRQRSPNPLQSK